MQKSPKKQARPKLADDLLNGAGSIADELGWTENAVYNAFQHKTLPITKVGGKLIARRSELEKRLSSLLP